MLTGEKKFTPTAMPAMLCTRGRKSARINGLYLLLRVFATVQQFKFLLIVLGARIAVVAKIRKIRFGRNFSLKIFGPHGRLQLIREGLEFDSKGFKLMMKKSRRGFSRCTLQKIPVRSNMM